MSEIKRCPFCGGEAEIMDEHKYIGGASQGFHRKYIHCVKCCNRTMSYDYDDKKAMIRAWNRRVSDESIH